jgi:putative toxin-antitoxin system antitoxin component (TIGR02293 family)
VTERIAAPGATEQPAREMAGIDVSAAAFVDRAAFIEAVRAGLPGEVVKQILDVVGYREFIVRLLGTTSANLHRIYRRKTLGPAQSEALLDALRVFDLAVRVFAGLAPAREWLETALPALDGRRPIDLCDTFEGRRLVRDAIRRIEYGEFP